MKHLLGLLTILCGTATTWAQGTVNFNNNVWEGTTPRRILGYPAAAPLIGTDYVAQLYFGTQGTAESSLTPVGAVGRYRVATTTMPGTWSGGTRTLPGITAGQTATLQVRSWNQTLFPAGYDAAVAGRGIYGASIPFDYTVPGGPLPAPNEFWMWNFVGFQLVHEPSLVALGLLGTLGLLVLRRAPASRTDGGGRSSASRQDVG